jgi:hypothetical protein
VGSTHRHSIRQPFALQMLDNIAHHQAFCGCFLAQRTFGVFYPVFSQFLPVLLIFLPTIRSLEGGGGGDFGKSVRIPLFSATSYDSVSKQAVKRLARPLPFIQNSRSRLHEIAVQFMILRNFRDNGSLRCYI